MSSKVDESNKIWTSSIVDAGCSSSEMIDFGKHYLVAISVKFLPNGTTLAEELNLKILT